MKARGSGSVEWRSGCWQVRVSNPKAPEGTPKRKWIKMPGIPRDDRSLAETQGAIISDRYRATGCVPIGRSELVSDWFDRWLDWRKSKGMSRVDSSKAQFKKWIEPDIGSLPMAGVVRDHGKRIVNKLDIAANQGAEISWKTAKNIWALVSKGFKDASTSKDPRLCILDANPFLGIAGPDKGPKKSKQFLYPVELLQLLSCEIIPLRRRRLYAFAVYSYMRAGEIAAINWDDIDIERGAIEVHSAIDRSLPIRERVEKGTKTNEARRFTLERPILAMLRVMLDEADLNESPRVFSRMSPIGGRGRLATIFRADLVRARIKRPSLLTESRTKKQIGFHDLRATACTWAAIRGDSPIKIMGRSGHTTLQVLMEYVRCAEAVREGFGEVFPELPEALLRSKRTAQELPKLPRNVPKTPSKQWPLRDSNPSSESSESPRKTAKRTLDPAPELPIRFETAGREPVDPLSAEIASLSEALVLAMREGDRELARELRADLAALRRERSGMPAVGEPPKLRIVKKPVES